MSDLSPRNNSVQAPTQRPQIANQIKLQAFRCETETKTLSETEGKHEKLEDSLEDRQNARLSELEFDLAAARRMIVTLEDHVKDLVDDPDFRIAQISRLDQKVLDLETECLHGRKEVKRLCDELVTGETRVAESRDSINELITENWENSIGFSTRIGELEKETQIQAATICRLESQLQDEATVTKEEEYSIALSEMIDKLEDSLQKERQKTESYQADIKRFSHEIREGQDNFNMINKRLEVANIRILELEHNYDDAVKQINGIEDLLVDRASEELVSERNLRMQGDRLLERQATLIQTLNDALLTEREEVERVQNQIVHFQQIINLPDNGVLPAEAAQTSHAPKEENKELRDEFTQLNQEDEALVAEANGTRDRGAGLEEVIKELEAEGNVLKNPEPRRSERLAAKRARECGNDDDYEGGNNDEDGYYTRSQKRRTKKVKRSRR